ncbi:MULTISPECIES: hypothetical protein [Acinetobacter]|uniref:hypothetical protein n=1 Tax=Acinetobacter TaxID=469 RepID=UPI0002CF7655|nr:MULTISPECIES: hypothetical protein [Acinetobacter]ENX63430.1 hypothetical protein F885_00712 [Acinetobacter higginsii]MCH7317490.1 hypothetical protein [Acinetobacter higginsii]
MDIYSIAYDREQRPVGSSPDLDINLKGKEITFFIEQTTLTKTVEDFIKYHHNKEEFDDEVEIFNFIGYSTCGLSIAVCTLRTKHTVCGNYIFDGITNTGDYFVGLTEDFVDPIEFDKDLELDCYTEFVGFAIATKSYVGLPVKIFEKKLCTLTADFIKQSREISEHLLLPF